MPLWNWNKSVPLHHFCLQMFDLIHVHMECLCGLLLTRGWSQKSVTALLEITCCLFGYDAMYPGKHTHQIIWCHIPEDSFLHSHCHCKPKFCVLLFHYRLFLFPEMLIWQRLCCSEPSELHNSCILVFELCSYYGRGFQYLCLWWVAVIWRVQWCCVLDNSKYFSEVGVILLLENHTYCREFHFLEKVLSFGCKLPVHQLQVQQAHLICRLIHHGFSYCGRIIVATFVLSCSCVACLQLRLRRHAE